jgi:hypothetical protein
MAAFEVVNGHKQVCGLADAQLRLSSATPALAAALADDI